MFGKLVENIKYKSLFEPDARTTATTYYNGYTVTDQSGTGIDVIDYNDAVFTLNVGTNGAGGSFDAEIVGANDDDPSSAVSVTDADFGSISTTSDDQIHIGSLDVSGSFRYLWLKTVQDATTETNYSAQVSLGKPVEVPVTQDVDVTFDV